MARMFKDPLLHFAILGGAIFLIFGVFGPAEPRDPEGRVPSGPERRIVVRPDDIARLEAGFEAVWNRPPAAEERAGLVEDHVTEEILVREALSLGLDTGDAVIRRRLRQKMEFLLEGSAIRADPGPGELEAWFAANRDAFATSPRIAFEQIYLGPSPPDPGEIAAMLQGLAAGRPSVEFGRQTLLPARLPSSPRAAVDGTFGRGVFAALAEFPQGLWHGPVQSGYGYHLVRLDARQPSRVPALAEIRAEVLAAWRHAAGETARAARMERIRGSYDIVLPDAVKQQ